MLPNQGKHAGLLGEFSTNSFLERQTAVMEAYILRQGFTEAVGVKAEAVGVKGFVLHAQQIRFHT